jgi:hypothetical protein
MQCTIVHFLSELGCAHQMIDMPFRQFPPLFAVILKRREIVSDAPGLIVADGGGDFAVASLGDQSGIVTAQDGTGIAH